MSFASDVAKFMKHEVEEKLRQEVETIVQFGLGFAKTTCPVSEGNPPKGTYTGSGHYRRSIKHNEGVPAGGSVTGMVNDPYAVQFIFVEDWLVPYAKRIEYDSWSRKAPQGVFGVTASAMKARFNL